MRVIFKKTSDVEDVPDGYARNYLIPKGLAVIATALEIRKLENERQKRSVEEEKKKVELELISKKLDGKLITVFKKSSEEGKLFGSVTTKEISEAINSQLGIRIDKHNIKIETPIKTVGKHEIVIDLGIGVKERLCLLIEKNSN